MLNVRHRRIRKNGYGTLSRPRTRAVERPPNLLFDDSRPGVADQQRSSRGIRHVVDAGGRLIVRVNTGSLPLEHGGRAFDLLAAVSSVTRPGAVNPWATAVTTPGDDGGPTCEFCGPGSACAASPPKPSAWRTRKSAATLPARGTRCNRRPSATLRYELTAVARDAHWAEARARVSVTNVNEPPSAEDDEATWSRTVVAAAEEEEEEVTIALVRRSSSPPLG